MAEETYTQVPPDSTGDKIRNIQAVIVKPDGSETLVSMQVVALTDSDGRLVYNSTAKIEELLSAQNDILESMLEVLIEMGAYDTKQALAKKAGRYHRTMKG